MIDNRKIEVVWVCHFSDAKLRQRLKFRSPFVQKVLHTIIRRPFNTWNFDYARWNRNAIDFFEHFDDIHLTIVFPHRGIKGDIQKFTDHSIDYVCFRSEDESPLFYLKRRLTGNKAFQYDKNRKIIKSIIEERNPSIVHIIGAENPYYSLCAKDLPTSVISIVSLETLMNSEKFKKDYRIGDSQFNYRAEGEKDVINSCDYIATQVPSLRKDVLNNINEDAKFLSITLAVGVDVNTYYERKEYDFVYFAVDIRKAADDAIKAFAIAKSKRPDITLNISGGYSKEYKDYLDKLIDSLGLASSVVFSGLQTSYETVIAQIKKSKYALLPLTVDILPSTIREAMACGLPVVTTVTEATPSLNKDRESVLLSQRGDYEAMASNMLILLDDKSKAEKLKENACITVKERYSNEAYMQKWRRAYNELYRAKCDGTPISDDLIS